MESQRKSERVKIAYKNHKGKKWGPSIHTNKKKLLLRDKGESTDPYQNNKFVLEICKLEKEAQNNPLNPQFKVFNNGSFNKTMNWLKIY